jgi:hypothetical protein
VAASSHFITEAGLNLGLFWNSLIQLKPTLIATRGVAAAGCGVRGEMGRRPRLGAAIAGSGPWKTLRTLTASPPRPPAIVTLQAHGQCRIVVRDLFLFILLLSTYDVYF